MSRMAEPIATEPDRETADIGLFVYGVIGAAARLPTGLVGLDEAPLSKVAHGRVAAVVTPIAVERPPGRRVDLLNYSGTLDVLAEHVTVIPVQFGSVLAGDQDLIESLLEPREAELVAMLEELEDRAQFTFQARYLESVVLSEVVTANPEIKELRRRTRDLPDDVAYGDRIRLGELVARAIDQKRGVDTALLLDAIVPLTVAHTIRPVSGLERLLEMSVLVENDRQPEFERALETLAEGVHERLRLRLMGPMAPYDFVRGV
jgi:hypothetical protein